ncbi:MAG: hypothetical protein ACQGVK_24510 [Myxococcota bacterium]
MRRKMFSIGALLLVLAVGAGVSQAQTLKQEDVQRALSGLVVSLDDEAGTLHVKGANGEGGVFFVNDDTTIMNGPKKVGLSDLKAGWRVALDADAKGHRWIATYIEVIEE